MAGLTTLTTGMTGAQFRTAFNSNFAIPPKVYNVKNYGAVADGVTDDTSKIQDAIDACFAGGGGTVFFPNGVYIIGGALQNDVGANAVDYNSQLYIPDTKPTNYGCVIRLLGESYTTAGYDTNSTDGVILKSTIAGSGDFPSVICSRAKSAPYNFNNYTKVEIENMRIFVDANEGDSGPTMGGINLIFAARSYVNNVVIGVDVASASMAEPTNKTFGIAMGFVQDDFPAFGQVIVRGGFYYGAILGEGVSGHKLETYRNKYGMMILKSYYGINIDYVVAHWNQYTIAAQDDTYYTEVAGKAVLKIGLLATEINTTGSTPAYTDNVDTILDASNYIYGEIAYNASVDATLGEYLTKSNGGLNLLMRNIYKNSTFHWTTATRPATPGYGTMGWNTTTSKLEVWNGATWADLH